MTSCLSDTDPLAEKVKIELLRQMPTGKKLQLVSDLIVTGRRLSLVGVRARFPEAGPEELRRRLSTLVLGADLASKVYGPEPFPPTL